MIIGDIMFIIKEGLRVEETIKKSQFYSFLYYVQNEEDISLALNEVKTLLPRATHYTYAYILGKHGEVYKYSDDKEPTNTAGIVIYDILHKRLLTNCLCVVVRFYGGIKLGIGGLQRAYRRLCLKAVAEAKLIPLINWTTLDLIVRYEDWSLVENRLLNYEITNKSFTNEVKAEVRVPEENLEDLIELLVGITNNSIIIKKSHK